MALTQGQWNKIQMSLPPEERETYASYLASLAEQAATTPVATGSTSTATKTDSAASVPTSPLQSFKEAEAAAAKTDSAASIDAPAPVDVPDPDPIVVEGGDGKVLGQGNTGDGQGDLPPGGDTTSWTATDGTIFDNEELYNKYQALLDEKKNVKTFTASDGTVFNDEATYGKYESILKGQMADKASAAAALKVAQDEKTAERQSAYDLLYSQFKQYGLESLVDPLKGLITTGASPSEFTIKLRETDAYKKRFAGNAARIAKGLTALDEATYLAKEDAYQNVMRNYGLPASYWQKDALGTQKGFEQLIANDVSAAELESRVQQAADIVDKGPKEYMDAIQQFYPGVTRSDLLSYVLDPTNALTKIQAKLGAAKIGGEYLRAGLTADQARAEELQLQGVTAEKARQGAQAVNELAPRGSQLADIYKQGPYGQADVESEFYNLGNAADAKKKRQKLVDLETGSFSGRSGVGVLDRERSGLY